MDQCSFEHDDDACLLRRGLHTGRGERRSHHIHTPLLLLHDRSPPGTRGGPRRVACARSFRAYARISADLPHAQIGRGERLLEEVGRPSRGRACPSGKD